MRARAKGRRMEQSQLLTWKYDAALLGPLAEGSLSILDLEGPGAWAQARAELRGQERLPCHHLPPDPRQTWTDPLATPPATRAKELGVVAPCLLPELVQLTQPWGHRERMDPGASCYWFHCCLPLAPRWDPALPPCFSIRISGLIIFRWNLSGPLHPHIPPAWPPCSPSPVVYPADCH